MRESDAEERSMLCPYQLSAVQHVRARVSLHLSARGEEGSLEGLRHDIVQGDGCVLRAGLERGVHVDGLRCVTILRVQRLASCRLRGGGSLEHLGEVKARDDSTDPRSNPENFAGKL